MTSANIKFTDFISFISSPAEDFMPLLDMEYRLFRKIEYARSGVIITRGFSSVAVCRSCNYCPKPHKDPRREIT